MLSECHSSNGSSKCQNTMSRYKGTFETAFRVVHNMLMHDLFAKKRSWLIAWLCMSVLIFGIDFCFPTDPSQRVSSYYVTARGRESWRARETGD